MSKKTVKWYMPDRGFIQFEDEEECHLVTDEVKTFLADKDSINGKEVEVEFKKDATDDDVVCKVVIGKGAAKKEEKKEEPPKEEKKAEPEKQLEPVTGEGVDKVVHGVSVGKRTIVFKDDQEKWYDLDASLDIDDIKNNFKTKTPVSVILDGDTVVSMVAREVEETAEEPKKEKSSSKNSYDEPKTEKDAFYRVKELERYVRILENDKQASIEAQAAVNAANQTVSTLFAGKFDASNTKDGDTVKALVKVIAESNYNLIQELKNSKESK